MNILLIAPHPFYQERGTPIAVDMLLAVLSAEGHHVDVCTFPEGEPRTYAGVSIHRARPWGGVSGVTPGFSIRKLYTDVFLFFLARRLCRRNRYDVAHTIEEAGFFGWFFARRYGVPYIYDMDSVLSDQLIESRPWLAPLRRMFEGLENRVIAGARVLAPMCQALADRAGADRERDVVVLKDVSLLGDTAPDPAAHEDLRREFDIAGPLVLYIGNLEPYQGIDLLLEALTGATDATLVVIGGQPEHIRGYQKRAQALGVADRVRLIGPRPVSRLAMYLQQADVLVSPRIRGHNTPMKIYSYLHSGVVLLATDLPTHTQVLDPDIAELAAPEPEAFGRALARLVEDPELRARKGRRAMEYARQEHSYDSFRRSVRRLYRKVDGSCPQSPA